MKYKVGNKVSLASIEKKTIFTEKIKKHNAHGIVLRTSAYDTYPYLVQWMDEKLNLIGIYPHIEEELKLIPQPEIGDYVITKKNIIGKIIRTTPKSYELQSSDLKTFMVRSHNVIKIEI
jgi:hypothetical protein